MLFRSNVTDFSSLRFTNNGMVFAIAIVPKGDDIAKPDSASKLSGLGVIGSGTTTTVAATTSVTGTTVAATGTTVAGATTTVAASGATTTTGK